MLRESLATLPVEVDTDEAGNLWAVLRGDVAGHARRRQPPRQRAQGRLARRRARRDGGLELLRALAAEGTPPVTVALVDWADEEGARFSRSLFGSAAAVGTLDIDILRGLTDKEGNAAAGGPRRARRRHRRPRRARARRMADVKAYVEVHIEQGPVLEARVSASARSPARRASSASG